VGVTEGVLGVPTMLGTSENPLRLRSVTSPAPLPSPPPSPPPLEAGGRDGGYALAC
jgi:hypothetical protein